jgi:hypothetical protein
MTGLAPDRFSQGTRGLVGLSVRRRDPNPVATPLYEDMLV